MHDAAELHAKAVHLGKLSVRMTAASGSGHPSSALSLAHLVAHLMYERMRFDPADPWNPAADRLVLSEGHAVPVVYAAYADLGGVVGRDRASARALCESDVDTLRERDSELDGHPNPAEGFPFFDAATGSLGQGLSVAAGLALAARRDGLNRRIFCIIGDGESREGQIWEAADFVADHKLTSVCAIFNCNGQGQAADVSAQQSAERVAEKLAAYGWEVASIDGHDPDAIRAAFDKAEKSQRPFAVVARTVKGWGVEKFLSGNWHGKPLKPAGVEDAYASLDAKLKSICKHAPQAANLRPPAPPSVSKRAQRGVPASLEWPAFAEAMDAAGFATALESGRLSTRRAYGAALKTAGDLLPQVAALDGDVSNSTFSNLFQAAHPERFFECKIAEQNMISVAAGLSAAGFIPVANSFAKFLSRAYDQIEMANISRANLKLVGSHSGISLAADGPSQMALLDVAYFRSFTSLRGDDRESPLCWVFQPSDAVAAYHCTRMMIELDGMCYIRTHRPDVPLLYGADATFEPRGFNVLSSGDDIALVASGYMVHEARKAADQLAKQHVRAAIIDAYCLPLDGERMIEAIARNGGLALVVEDNYGGGFGAEVAEWAARLGRTRVASLHCQRRPKSTKSADEAVDYCGVSATHIADHALALLRTPRG